MFHLNAMTLAGVLLATMPLAGGCAMSGTANASAQRATATSGAAKNETIISITIALGDTVAKAAADLAKNIIGGISGPITEKAKQEAVQKGVEKGLETAKAEGKEPTPKETAELKEHVEDAVDAAAQGKEDAAKQ